MKVTKLITFALVKTISFIKHMNSSTSNYKFIFPVICLFLAGYLQSQIPAGYYKNAEGKKKADLKTVLHNIVRSHTVLEYYASSTYFRTTDWNPNGYFWDMYSNYHRTYWSGMNREHSLPKSWWSSAPETTEAYSDLHNLYPSDETANSAKLNYSLGEVTGTPEYTNGVVKVGANGFPGYTGTVFEPADEYKGDFARDYMYVVTCYEDYAKNWRSTGTQSMLLGGSTYPVFKTWAIDLLLKWSRQDPVSSKEIDRNNAVYSFQNNRNPFIDHPELAEYIWGKYMGDSWLDDGTLPEEVTFKIDPFPVVKSSLKVQLNHPEKSTYYVKAISGIVLKTGNFSEQGTVEVGELENGMYLLEIYSASQKRIVAKFIIRH
jgi:endonuclease I